MVCLFKVEKGNLQSWARLGLLCACAPVPGSDAGPWSPVVWAAPFPIAPALGRSLGNIYPKAYGVESDPSDRLT